MYTIASRISPYDCSSSDPCAVPTGGELAESLLSRIEQDAPHLLDSARRGLWSQPLHATVQQRKEAEQKAQQSVSSLIEITNATSSGSVTLTDQDFVR